MTTCGICNDTGWICENCKTVWTDENGDSCCGAGDPCKCNASGFYEPSGFVEFDAAKASRKSVAVIKGERT
jgi:hypothetical protein